MSENPMDDYWPNSEGREADTLRRQQAYDENLFAVLDDLARKVTALIRAGKTSVGAPEMHAVDALEKVYPTEYARWVERAK